MRIPLSIIKGRLQVAASFYAPRYHTGLALIDFVVDTGSTVSMIGYGDVEEMGLPQSSLPFREHSFIGGTSMGLHTLRNIRLSFSDDEGGLQPFKLKEFGASIPSRKNVEARDHAKEIPSILGLDFLTLNNMALYCSPSRNVAYFEAIEP